MCMLMVLAGYYTTKKEGYFKFNSVASVAVLQAGVSCLRKHCSYMHEPSCNIHLLLHIQSAKFTSFDLVPGKGWDSTNIHVLLD